MVPSTILTKPTTLFRTPISTQIQEAIRQPLFKISVTGFPLPIIPRMAVPMAGTILLLPFLIFQRCKIRINTGYLSATVAPPVSFKPIVLPKKLYVPKTREPLDTLAAPTALTGMKTTILAWAWVPYRKIPQLTNNPGLATTTVPGMIMASLTPIGLPPWINTCLPATLPCRKAVQTQSNITGISTT